MKKITLALIAMMLIIFVSSCKKDNPTDFWSFEGNTYYVDSTTVSPFTYNHWSSNIALNITSTSTVNTDIGYSNLYFIFPNYTLPTTNGTYTVVSTNPTGMQVFITFFRNSDTKGNFSYSTTGGDGNEKVTVTVGPTGLVSLSGSGIVLQNNASPYDSSALNFNVTQKQ
jgi:hypothetical protein